MSTRGEDDDSFVGYVPSTVDWGGGLFASVCFAFLISYCVVLPALVIWTRRRQAHLRRNDETLCLEGSDEDTNDKRHISSRVKDGNSVNSENYNNTVKKEGDDDDDRSTASSQRSAQSSVLGGAVEAILEQRQLPRTRAARRRRRKAERRKQSAQWNANQNNGDDEDVKSKTLMQGIFPGSEHKDAVQVDDPPSKEDNESSSEEEPLANAGEEPEVVTLSDETPSEESMKYASDYNSLKFFDKMALIVNWDAENNRMMKLCAPYCIQSIVGGLADVATTAAVGKLIGSRSVSAFVLVDLLLGVSDEFVGSVGDAFGTLASQAIGTGNKKLAGQYLQISLVLYMISFTPFLIFWGFYMEPALIWMGLDEEAAAIGKQYNYILIVDYVLDGFSEHLHELLDIGGFENYSTVIGCVEEILSFIVVLLVAMYGSPDLFTIGLIQFWIGVVFLGLNMWIIKRKGWFDPYMEGMIGSFALKNRKALWLILKTTVPLAIGTVLTDAEWELLTLFASFLGPAEVAAWAILDTIWDASNDLLEALADACEVRVTYLLGEGSPDRAKISGYKAALICIFTGIYINAFIYIFGDDLPTWMTDDPVLQKLLSDMLPLFGLGNFIVSLDTISWTVLAAQSRFKLATNIVWVSSWFVTVPLAVLFAVHWNVNLQGQMAALLFGEIVCGVAHNYFVLCSDWDKISESVQEDHRKAGMVEEAVAEVTASNSDQASGTPGPSMRPMEIAS